MIGPLFSTRSIWMARFSGFLCERPHFSDILVYAHIFRSEIFWGYLSSFGITWIDCDICVITCKKWVQKVKGQYMNRSTFLMIKYVNNVITCKKWVQKVKGQYMNRSTFLMIKYMNGSVFSKARYMNGVGFEELRTTRPKDKSAQDNSAQKKVGPRQLGPSRPNFRRQLGPNRPNFWRPLSPGKSDTL